MVRKGFKLKLQKCSKDIGECATEFQHGSARVWCRRKARLTSEELTMQAQVTTYRGQPRPVLPQARNRLLAFPLGDNRLLRTEI